MTNESSRPGSSRLLLLASVSLLTLAAACSSKLDQNPFGSPPSAAGGVAGWVLNGEAGEAPSVGGSSVGPRGNGGSAADAKAGSPAVGGNPGGSGGSGSGAAATGGASGSGSGGVGGGGGASSGGGGVPSGGPQGGEGGSEQDPPPKVHAFLLSEYVEGSSNNKAVELFASEASSLDGCELHFYFNGGVEPTRLLLEGALTDGATHAVCTEELAARIAPRCARVASLRFNGNDAVSLVCDGAVIDSLGKVGEDPGKGWGSGEASTVDRTLRRRCEARPDLVPNDTFEPASDWEAFPADSFDDLGTRVCVPDAGAGGAAGHGGDAGYGGESSGAGAGAAGVALD